MRREDRSNMLIYGSMVFGGFGPTTPWYENLMTQADAVSAWIMERVSGDALTPDGIGAAIYGEADAGNIENGKPCCWSAHCCRRASTRRSIR